MREGNIVNDALSRLSESLFPIPLPHPQNERERHLQSFDKRERASFTVIYNQVIVNDALSRLSESLFPIPLPYSPSSSPPIPSIREKERERRNEGGKE